MKISILDADTLGTDISLYKISSLGECEFFNMSFDYEIPEKIKDSDIVVINKVRLGKKELENARNLKLICIAATGYDNIDLDYCKKHLIKVCNVKGYSTKSVAQLTLAMVFSLSVHLPEYNNFVKSGEYTKGKRANKLTPVYHELYKKTWGIVGYGNIGKEVGKIARALGCEVIFNKRTNSEEGSVSLEELCEKSDIITIHTPLTDSTRGLINQKMISLMKPDVILVNTSRGAVTDEYAVRNAINTGKIGAFGTDVYSEEPFSENHPFYSIKELPNVCLTPHMAWGSFESRERCVDEISKNIIAFLQGKSRNVVV